MLSIFAFNLVELLILSGIYYNYKSSKSNLLASKFKTKKLGIAHALDYCKFP